MDFNPSHWVQPSEVRLGVAPSVDDLLEEVRSGVLSCGRDTRLVSVMYDRLPAMEPLIDKILTDLAAVTLALWPDWYHGVIDFASIEPSPSTFEDRLSETLAASGKLRRPLSISWIREARKLCRASRAPLMKAVARTVQAAQLALAIAPRDLLIALTVGEAEQTPGHLLGLSRAAEWLGRATGAGVLVIVPSALAGSSELDGINFDPFYPRPRSVSDSPGSAESESASVWPIIGRPHPYSPGEQLQARRLALDEMLGKLFQFNVRVKTRFENLFLVDLLWPEGRVVVEVDGYRHHSNRVAFAIDRRRDYELLVSGYLVLRLPHDEVIEDVAIAVEKIRDVVRLRWNEGGPQP